MTFDPQYVPAPELLRERVILITGAGDGIGRAVARACAAHGATVILAGRTKRKLEAVYDEIEHAGHPQAVIHPMNLESLTPPDCDAIAEAIDQNFGRLDGLLHNAGWLGALTPVANYEPEMWLRVVQLNLNAPFLLTQTLLGLLNRAPEASVVFTTDAVAQRAQAYYGAYAAAKGGIEVFARMLASELEANTRIRVNTIDPGEVRTNLRIRTFPGTAPDAWPYPDTIVNPYLWLLGPDSVGTRGERVLAQPG